MKKAFTLIELLVVIAIIAILAAILFPVFAQAKESAKNTQLLSNIKQQGTAGIMYANDADDQFCPTMASQPVIDGDYGWQDLSQPYAKNYDVYINPKRTRPTGTTAEIAFKRLQHMATYPRAVTSAFATVATTNGYFGGAGVTHSGVANVRWDGIGGFVNLAPPTADWLGRKASPSLTSSQVAEPSVCAMFFESTNWDAWASLHTADANVMGYCYRWNPATFSAEGALYTFAGASATTRPDNDTVIRDGIRACAVSKGKTTYVATDSSAKSVDVRQFFYNGTLSQATAGEYWIKALNPSGK